VTTWKERLGDRIPAELGREIDIYETQMELRKQGKVPEKVFAETRLRRGMYGQRYDNGQRHDGVAVRPLEFPRPWTKGPDTVWDAPGMLRIKIPMGRMTADQLDEMSDLAQEHADDILHVTTRQDIQLHFVHMDDGPALMRRLASVGITTREACGNSVRNICACQFTGVCKDEAFDVTPYAEACTYFLLGHKDIQDFGRKFKIAFSGCKEHACGLANFHCIGVIGVTREIDGERVRGFEFLVGGGLGAVPRQAKLFDDFLPPEELLPMCQAVSRVFARLGEKDNRSRARVKFLVQKLGIDEFRKLVLEERAKLPHDERWTAFLDDLHKTDETPVKPGSQLADDAIAAAGDDFAQWLATNTRPQKQDGYVAATVRCPLGDITSDQGRKLADMARRYTGDTMCCTVEQNIVFRWVSKGDLPAFYAELAAIGLGGAGASTLSDITSCPGTDTCKLGISASRGLAAELEDRLGARLSTMDDGVKKLRLKTSGCFNSCGQHHVADIGMLGVARSVNGRRVSHFQLVVGGEWANNAGSYGLQVGAFPSKRIPEVVDRLTAHWVEEREDGETFQAFIKRIGKKSVRSLLDDLKHVPTYEEDPDFYVDWGDAREYTVEDKGVGECAGEVVSFASFGLHEAEREAFEAQLHLEAGDAVKAAKTAYRAMLSAAQSLVRIWNIDVTNDTDDIYNQFKTRLIDSKLFFDKYAKGKFAAYLTKTYTNPPTDDVDGEAAHRLIEETNLFIEASHSAYERIQNQSTAVAEPAKPSQITKSLNIL